MLLFPFILQPHWEEKLSKARRVKWSRGVEKGKEVAVEEMRTEISIFLEKDFLEFLSDLVCGRQLRDSA